MGLLDQVGAAASGVAGEGQTSGVNAMLLQQLMAMLGKPGALDKVFGAFQSAGLGNVLQSWIGSEQNLPISGDQVRTVLGGGTLAELSKRAGIGESETANMLSGLLPEVIDKLTPDGNVPSQPDFGGLLSSLGGQAG